MVISQENGRFHLNDIFLLMVISSDFIRINKGWFMICILSFGGNLFGIIIGTTTLEQFSSKQSRSLLMDDLMLILSIAASRNHLILPSFVTLIEDVICSILPFPSHLVVDNSHHPIIPWSYAQSSHPSHMIPYDPIPSYHPIIP